MNASITIASPSPLEIGLKQRRPAMPHHAQQQASERVRPNSPVRLLTLAVLVLVSLGLFFVASPREARAASSVPNAAIADKALQYNGRYGGAACVDADFSGYTGGAPLGSGDNMDGECRSFVNCILKMVLGINVAYGSDDYQRAFREQGGQPISLVGGMKGDIIQVGNGEHTAIINRNLGNGTYEVIDSNFVGHHLVGVHSYTPPPYAQIWRMGTVHVAIRSLAAKRYVSSELGDSGADYGMLRAGSTSIGSWESFALVGDCSRACALRSDANGLFVTAELGYQGYAWGETRARSGVAQAWQQWRLVGNCDVSCSLLSLANDRYVSTELAYTGAGQNMLRARATTIGGWEKFQLQPLASSPTAPPTAGGGSSGGSGGGVAGSGGNGDGSTPSAPVGLSTGTITQNTIGFQWSPSTGNVGVAGYELLLNGGQVGTTNATTFTFAGLACGTGYTLGVVAYDAAGNTSDISSVESSTAGCPAPTTYPETTGGVTHTWTNYTNAGGTQGSSIPPNATVQIACRLAGWTAPDGNNSWYRIASAPWNGAYYASADAFYNNGATTGSLAGTPFVDTNVPLC